MADFFFFEADVSGSDSIENEDNNSDEMKSFINDDSESDNDSGNFQFHNSEIDLNEANQRIEKEALARIENCDDYSNLSYVSHEDELSSIFEFPNYKNHIEKFKSSLLPVNKDNIHHTFIRVILYKIRQIIEDKTDICDDDTLKENKTLEEILEKLSNEKFTFSLDLQKFDLVCYEINDILINYNFFLRVFEQKNKYRYLLIKEPEKQNQVKQLASCLNQKYNGFQVIKNSFNKNERRDFEPVDIIYIPTKNAQILPDCYYTTNISNAYTALYSEGLKNYRAFTVYECYYCNKFFRQKHKKEHHLKICSGKPGIVYNFCSQTLTSFEDNFSAKGDVPFSIYFDFETTSPTDSEWLDPEDKKMFVMSYVIVVAFHPHFEFDRVLIQRSVCHSKEELTSVNYLTREQFAFKIPEIIKQLYDQALHVSKRTTKNALGVMFGIELSFVKSTLLNWFNKKVSAPFKRIDQSVIKKYEQENPFCWSQERDCVICKMPLRPIFSSPERPDSKMYYGDYIIRYEFKFLRNIYSQEQLNWSPELKSLESYYEAFESFIHHAIEIYRLLSSFNLRLKDISGQVRQFLQSHFDDYDLGYIKNEIMQTDIKNALKLTGRSVPKFRLKIYAYLYDELICFPPDTNYDTVTSKKILIMFINK